jgi:Bacterial PH domain
VRSRGTKGEDGAEDGKSVGRPTRAQLFDGETVVMVARPARFATFPKFLATLGLYSLWRKRDTSVVTNQRILFGKGIFNRTERSIPLANIDDVAFARRGINSYADLTVDERGRSTVRRIGPMGPRTAHRFTKEVLRRL